MTILLLLLTMILGSGIFISGVSYVFYCYEAVRTPHHSHRTAAPARWGLPWCVALGFFSSVSSQVLAYLSYPTGITASRVNPASPAWSDRPPVVLVHGLYHNASAWYFYKWWLKRRGYENIICISYNTIKHDFWYLASRLKRTVAKTYALHGGQPVVLIGHSLGGLLIRAAIADAETAGKVGAAVVLGAPHRGSKLAALALGRLGRSIQYDAPLIQRLNAMPSPRSLPKLNLYSPVDNMVLPTSSLEIQQEGWTQIQTDPISHVSMLYHPSTLRLALDFVDESTSHCRRAAGRPAAAPSHHATTRA